MVFVQYKLKCRTVQDYLTNIQWRKQDIPEHEIANDYLLDLWYKKAEAFLKQMITNEDWSSGQYKPTGIIMTKFNKKEYQRLYQKIPRLLTYKRNWMRKKRSDDRKRFGIALY